MRFLPIVFLLLQGCTPQTPEVAISGKANQAEPVKTGAHVIMEDGFHLLGGRRVGLIVNHTALVDSVHLIDLIAQAPNVELGALFGPEHGLRGMEDAGEQVTYGVDERTGVPVYSLYGNTRRPTQEMLEGLDVLVFDIQDIGARFYTYISTMGLAMQSAAEFDIPFIVLDRPNPLGGTLVSGYLCEPEYESFVGQYPIPIIHGLTVGELARMIKGNDMLPGLESLDLTIVGLRNWRRDMLWPDTGLPWVPTSPNIPDFETALIYPGMCLFEGTGASEGRGTYAPFKQIGAPGADSESLVSTLNRHVLAGVSFEEATFTPRSLEGMSSYPKLLDTPLQGIRLTVTDRSTFRPLDTGIYILHAFYHQASVSTQNTFFNQAWLSTLSGTTRLYEMMTAGATPEEIISSWEEEEDAFRRARRPYLLYE